MTPVRRSVRLMGAPARALLIGSIRVYRATLSGWLGGQCRFYPSCSHYAEDAIRAHGAVKGSLLATWRILRCNPYGAGGVDDVPSRADGVDSGAKRRTASYVDHADAGERVHV